MPWKVGGESGKLFGFGCHFPPKLANFGTLDAHLARLYASCHSCAALKKLTLGLVDSLNDGASIVNLASLAGIGWEGELDKIKAAEGLSYAGVADFAAAHEITPDISYFFTKQALVAWTHESRWTWRDRGIRMNAVSPGPVDTPILGDFLETLGERAEEDMRIMDRPGAPTDIAPVVTFLLSDGSVWLRGVNIATDGGMRAHIDATSHGLS